LFEPEASREAEGELFDHRTSIRIFGVKKMTTGAKRINLSLPINACFRLRVIVKK
jgi:hypothetical protein